MTSSAWNPSSYVVFVVVRLQNWRFVQEEDGITYVYIKSNNVYLLAVSNRNANASMILLFLYRITEVFKYVVLLLTPSVFHHNCDKLTHRVSSKGNTSKNSKRRVFETTLWSSTSCWMRWWILAFHRQQSRRSFRYNRWSIWFVAVVASQQSNLLNCVLNHHDLIKSRNREWILNTRVTQQEYITQESFKLDADVRPPPAITNAVSWRSENIKYRKNEVFLDVMESGGCEFWSFLLSYSSNVSLLEYSITVETKERETLSKTLCVCMYSVCLSVFCLLCLSLIWIFLPVNLLVNMNGTVLRSEIVGCVKMKSYLSGMPELRLGLNDRVQFESTGRRECFSVDLPCCFDILSFFVFLFLSFPSFCLFVSGAGSAVAVLCRSLTPPRSETGSRHGRAIEMEDVSFHQCVRLSRFENDRTISFIPPDGEFELMTYRWVHFLSSIVVSHHSLIVIVHSCCCTTNVSLIFFPWFAAWIHTSNRLFGSKLLLISMLAHDWSTWWRHDRSSSNGPRRTMWRFVFPFRLMWIRPSSKLVASLIRVLVPDVCSFVRHIDCVSCNFTAYLTLLRNDLTDILFRALWEKWSTFPKRIRWFGPLSNLAEEKSIWCGLISVFHPFKTVRLDVLSVYLSLHTHLCLGAFNSWFLSPCMCIINYGYWLNNPLPLVLTRSIFVLCSPPCCYRRGIGWASSGLCQLWDSVLHCFGNSSAVSQNYRAIGLQCPAVGAIHH